MVGQHVCGDSSWARRGGRVASEHERYLHSIPRRLVDVMTTATGIGSWPGQDVREPLRIVRELLGGLDPDSDGVTGLPYLPELPGRGPGGDLIGRTAGLLVDLPVDLQPAGWRLVDRPGRDLQRTAAFWREDLDVLAETFDGYAGQLKLAVAGPWTLAAGLWLPRGERAVVDPSAARDLTESLAEGLRGLLTTVAGHLPGAELVVQIDEPSLPTVLAGRLPTASGYGRLPAVDPQVVLPTIQTVLEAAGERHTLVHCCDRQPPQTLLRRAGAGGLAFDTALLTPAGWEGLAVAAEEGRRVYLGCVPTTGALPSVADLAADVAQAWARLGMPSAGLADLAVTPSCGLAGATAAEAIERQRRCVEVARALADRAVS